jgi:hypothetical protein
VHFIVSPRLEQNGWEAALGACRRWNDRVQHTNSQPWRFGCGERTLAAGEVAGKMAVSLQTALGENHHDRLA